MCQRQWLGREEVFEPAWVSHSDDRGRFELIHYEQLVGWNRADLTVVGEQGAQLQVVGNLSWTTGIGFG